MNEELKKRSLSEMLERLRVVDLKQLLADLSLKMRSGVKKAVMVKSIEKWLVENPAELIDHMLTYELRMYNDIVNHPEKRTRIPFALKQYPIEDITFTSDGEMIHYLAPELEPKLAPLFAAAIEEREKSGEEAVENRIVGLLNLRGTVDFLKLITFINSMESDPDKQDAIFRRFKRFIVSDGEERLVAVSPFAPFEFNPFNEYQVDSDTEPKEFSDKEIAEASTMPYPRIGGRAYDKLEKKLLSFGQSESEVRDYILERWLHKQRNTMNPVDGLHDFNFNSYKQVEELMPILTEYVNDVPFWKFKGWSSNEIAARMPKPKPGQMPHISIGSNMRAMGIESFEQLMEMARNGEEFPTQPFQTSAKVGRNDPCPCGSGKKYKHCCGRNR